MIGHAFCLPNRDCFFIVVNTHPDDEKTYLVVPACNCVLVGGADIPAPTMWGPTVIHCGYSLWLDHQKIEQAQPCLSEEQVSQVRKLLADLARGKPPEATPADSDPNYQEHEEELAKWSLEPT